MTYLDPIVTGLVAGIRRIERGSLLLRGLCADVACGRRQERGPVAIRILRAPRLPATVGSRGIPSPEDNSARQSRRRPRRW